MNTETAFLPRAEVLPGVEVESQVSAAFEKNWGVIVWNDPVNLTLYVVHVFQIVLKMDLHQARRHMLEVHQQGKSLVAVETREQAEFIAHRLQSYGLKATMEAI